MLNGSAFREPKAGDRIEEIILEEEIGRGGLGIVFKARFLGVPCAVKFFTDKIIFKHMGLIHREALPLYRLSHEFRDEEDSHYFVSVDDFEPFPPGNFPPFIRMEYIEGKDLARILQEKGAIPLSEALTILQHILLALRFAQSKGISHGDLKPSNILIPVSGRPPIKIADFGFGSPIEKAIQETSTLQESRPLTASIIGPYTQPYYPPQRVDERYLEDEKMRLACDLHAIGRILFEMLTGTKPTTMWPLERKMKLQQGFDDFMFRFVEERGGYPSAYETYDEVLEELSKIRESASHQYPAFITADACSVMVHSEPDEAEVYIAREGEIESYRGTTPLTIAPLEPGVYQIIVRKKYFDEWQEKIKLTKKDARYIRAELKPVKARLTIETKPEEAQVFLNGASKGLTPVILSGVPAGMYSLVLKKEGYEMLEAQFEIVSSEDKKITFQLEKNTKYFNFVDEIEEHLKEGRLSSAKKVLKGFQDNFPGSQKAKELGEQIAERQEQFAKLMEEAKDARKNACWMEAKMKAQQAQSINIEDTRPQAFLEGVEETASKVEAVYQSGQQKLKRGDFEGAIKEIEKGLALVPGSNELQNLKKTVEEKLAPIREDIEERNKAKKDTLWSLKILCILVGLFLVLLIVSILSSDPTNPAPGILGIVGVPLASFVILSLCALVEGMIKYISLSIKISRKRKGLF